MKTAKKEEPFIVLSGENDYCPVVVEENAGAIELAGAQRLVETITGLGGRTDLKSAGSADEFGSVGKKAIVLCARGGTLEKLLTPPQIESLGGNKGKSWNKESFLTYALSHDGGRYLVVFGDSAGLFYGAMTVADRLHFDQQGSVVTEETEKMYSPVLDNRMIATHVVQRPNKDYDSTQWKEGEEYNWKGFVDWLAGHRINHLMVQNTYEASGLTYPSRRFPQIVNQDAANVKREFYGDLIDYAHTRNMKVYFADFHFPLNALPLIVYPETIAPNCDPANVPKFASHCDDRIAEFEFKYLLGNYFACLSHPKTREYWRDITDEMISMYPQVDGLIIGGAEGVNRLEKTPRICNCPRCQGIKNIQGCLTDIFDVIYTTAMARKPELEIVLVDRAEYGLLWEHIEREGYDNVSIYWWCGHYPCYPSGFSGEREKRWDFIDDAWILGRFGGVGHLPMIIKAAKKHGTGLVNMNYWNKEVEIAYAAMSEFSWNPDLTFEQFGELFAIKTLRRKNRETSRAIALFAGIMDKVESPSHYFSFRNDDLPVVTEEIRELETLIPGIPDTPGFFNLRGYLDAFVKGFEKGLEYKNLVGCSDISKLTSEEGYERERKLNIEFFSGS